MSIVVDVDVPKRGLRGSETLHCHSASVELRGGLALAAAPNSADSNTIVAGRRSIDLEPSSGLQLVFWNKPSEGNMISHLDAISGESKKNRTLSADSYLRIINILQFDS